MRPLLTGGASPDLKSPARPCKIPDMTTPDPTLTDALRKALVDALAAGETFLGLEKKTGVLRQTLMTFARGEHSIRLNAADKLAAYFRLTLRPSRPRRR